MYILIYKDDLIIVGSNEKEINSLKEKLCTYFKMKDMGEVLTYLGIIIDHDTLS